MTSKTNSGDAKASSNNSGGGSFLGILLLIGIAVLLFSTIRRREPPVGEFVGLPLPPLHVEGWLNAAGPVRDDMLRGQLVLVDCWFVDCGPCRASMPHLAEFYRRYRDRVTLIGLTPDTGNDASRAAAFIESVPGADWPIGYGASTPLGMLGVQAYPTLILFDRAGKSVWSGHSAAGLEDVLATLLLEESRGSRVQSLGPEGSDLALDAQPSSLD